MKNATKLATFFFVAALTLTLQANSAPSTARTCYNAERKLVTSECEYHSLDTVTLRHEIETACRNIVRICPTVHRKLLGSNITRANVGVYNSTLIHTHMLLNSVHHSMAKSVSIFQSFLRPFGDSLTEETLRGVVLMQPGSVREELYDIYDFLATVTTKTYQLIENDINIHGCRIPDLPANTDITLRPFHPQQGISRRKMIVDGLTNELQSLASDVIELLQCMESRASSCNF